jgi:hypothetical protein
VVQHLLQSIENIHPSMILREWELYLGEAVCQDIQNGISSRWIPYLRRFNEQGSKLAMLIHELITRGYFRFVVYLHDKNTYPSITNTKKPLKMRCYICQSLYLSIFDEIIGKFKICYLCSKNSTCICDCYQHENCLKHSGTDKDTGLRLYFRNTLQDACLSTLMENNIPIRDDMKNVIINLYNLIMNYRRSKQTLPCVIE